MPKETTTWRFVDSGSERDVVLFDADLSRARWSPTGAKARVIDPLYGNEHEFDVYTVTIRKRRRSLFTYEEETHTVAVGEFSNNVFGFYVPADNSCPAPL